MSKRLKIPHSNGKPAKTDTPEKTTSEVRTPEKTTSAEVRTPEKTTSAEVRTPEKDTATDRTRVKRSAEETGKEKAADQSSDHRGKNAKRQFILGQPEAPAVQQPVVAYVPVVTSSPVLAPTMTSAAERNFVLNLPERNPGTFMLSVPSRQQVPQMYIPTPGGLGQHDILPEYQPNYVATATQRSGIATRRNYGVLQGSNGIPLSQLTGIMGTPIVRHGPHVTMFYNDPLPSRVQDEIFRERSLQGRAIIPGRYSLHKHHFDEDDYDPTDSDDTDEDLPGTPRIEDNGSYTERTLPDGRTVFRKDHVGFGPITVEASTAESALRHHDDATDMDLDSDKRKEIPKPVNERRRLEIPRPKERR